MVVYSFLYGPWCFINFGQIFGFAETCPEVCLGRPECLCVVWVESDLAF